MASWRILAEECFDLTYFKTESLAAVLRDGQREIKNSTGWAFIGDDSG